MGEREILMQEINEKIRRISGRADQVQEFATRNNQNLATITRGIEAARAKIGLLQGKIEQTLGRLTQIVDEVNKSLFEADRKLNTDEITDALRFDSQELARDVNALNDELARIETYLDDIDQGGARPGGFPPADLNPTEMARDEGQFLPGEKPDEPPGRGGGKRKKKGGYKYSIKKTHKRKKHTPNAGKKKTRSHKKRN